MAYDIAQRKATTTSSSPAVMTSAEASLRTPQNRAGIGMCSVSMPKTSVGAQVWRTPEVVYRSSLQLRMSLARSDAQRAGLKPRSYINSSELRSNPGLIPD
jgi:hypothetical protein